MRDPFLTEREKQIEEVIQKLGAIDGSSEMAFRQGAKWADMSMLKEIDHMISQLSQFAKTEHGQGQLAAWKEMKLFFK